jgi:hypothetical protein
LFFCLVSWIWIMIVAISGVSMSRTVPYTLSCNVVFVLSCVLFDGETGCACAFYEVVV